VSEGRISILKTRFGENNYEFGESKFEEHARGRGDGNQAAIVAGVCHGQPNI
jgi:hypothetical protein